MLYFRAYAILAAIFVAAVLFVLIVGGLLEPWLPLFSFHGAATALALIFVLWLLVWRIGK